MTKSIMENEVPAPVPADQPDWNESFLLAGHDGKTGVGFWMHLGRWRRDKSLWRETFTIALPDGTVLAHRGISNVLADENGPGATNYSIRVDEPGRKLSYHYRGGVHRVAAGDLEAGLLVNGAMVPLEMDLVFEGVSPVWDLHQEGGSQDFLGAAHIEQIGHVSGTIGIPGAKFQLHQAMGVRDRSMGPRKLRDLHRHHWIQGLFDNGTGFMLFDAEEASSGFSLAVVTQGDKIYPARVKIPFRIESLAQKYDPVRILLAYEGGELDIVSSKIANTWYLSFTYPSDTYVGVHPVPGSTNPRVMLEQSAFWTLNGSISGIGAIERTIPGDIAQEIDD